jgi:hypothetical protein
VVSDFFKKMQTQRQTQPPASIIEDRKRKIQDEIFSSLKLYDNVLIIGSRIVISSKIGDEIDFKNISLTLKLKDDEISFAKEKFNNYLQIMVKHIFDLLNDCILSDEDIFIFYGSYTNPTSKEDKEYKVDEVEAKLKKGMTVRDIIKEQIKLFENEIDLFINNKENLKKRKKISSIRNPYLSYLNIILAVLEEDFKFMAECLNDLLRNKIETLKNSLDYYIQKI